MTPSRSACVSGRLEAQRVLLECLAVGSWLVKYAPKVRAFCQTYGRNVSSATTRLFYFIFLALRHRWVLIINISHTCSPAVGRKRSTFVFSRKKSHRTEIKEMKPAAIQSETFAENPSEEECSWKWRKSGKPQLCRSGLRLVADPPPRLNPTADDDAPVQPNKSGYNGPKMEIRPFF